MGTIRQNGTFFLFLKLKENLPKCRGALVYELEFIKVILPFYLKYSKQKETPVVEVPLHYET